MVMLKVPNRSNLLGMNLPVLGLLLLYLPGHLARLSHLHLLERGQ